MINTNLLRVGAAITISASLAASVGGGFEPAAAEAPSLPMSSGNGATPTLAGVSYAGTVVDADAAMDRSPALR